ncbi:MAG: Gfo/Idh/MocA family oxidoreductase [Sphaerochaeta sp.]|jgi:hypothetical protein|uniref:Gfo/Idh/MocA family oxidoreductase n=1 Tax=Sphaerochaeta sp. TaxID=1972642 RepID=UPI002FCA8334
MRIVLIGYGWRSLFYYRIIKAFPERFTLVQWVLQSDARAEQVKAIYHVETTSKVEVALACPHDLVVLCVPAASLETSLSSLIDQGETILCETGFTPLSLQTLASIYARCKASSSTILVAEQYVRYPYYQSCHALLPLLGSLTEVHVGSVHGHHATSLIRHFLGEQGNNCSISAASRTSWVVKTGGRDSINTEGTRIQTKRTVAVFDFADGKTGYFDFADVQYHSNIRSGHFSLRGERGEIFDETVRHLNRNNEGVIQTMQRIEDGSWTNNPRSLRAVGFGDAYLFTNPYWPLGFNDDEIALALCLEDACQKKGYALAEALQDSYLAQCIQNSCATQTRVETEAQIWADALALKAN